MKNLCRSVLLLITLVYLASPFTPENFNLILLFILGVAVLIMAFPVMGKTTRYTVVCFLAASILIIVLLKKPFTIFMIGTSYMLYIASVLVIMKLFSIPIQLGNYGSTIESLMLKYFGQDKHLFLFTTALANLFSIFLLYGTVPITLSLMGDILRKRIKNFQQFASTSVGRGYAFMVTWSPCSIIVLLILKVTGLEWSQMFLFGLMLCALGIISSYLIDGRRYSAGREMVSYGSDRQETVSDNPKAPKRQEQKSSGSIIDIILVVMGMIIVTYLLERYFFFSAYYCVMLSGLFVFACWMLKFIKSKAIKSSFKTYWEGMSKEVDLIGLFVVFGIFAKAVESIGLADSLYYSLHIEQFGFLIIALIPLIIILLSLLGVNAAISVVIVGQLLVPAQVFLPKIAIALALCLGSSLSFMVSPFAGMILTMSNYVECRPGEISLKWNSKFSLIFFAEGVLFIYLLMAVGLL